MQKKSTEAQIKLFADALNRVGVSCIGIGVIGPFAGAIFGVAQVPLYIFIASSALFIAAGVVFHIWARAVLRRLDDDGSSDFRSDRDAGHTSGGSGVGSGGRGALRRQDEA